MKHNHQTCKIICAILRKELISRGRTTTDSLQEDDLFLAQIGYYFKGFLVRAAYEPSKEQVSWWIEAIKKFNAKNSLRVAKGEMSFEDAESFELLKETLLGMIDKKVNKTIQIAAA